MRIAHLNTRGAAHRKASIRKDTPVLTIAANTSTDILILTETKKLSFNAWQQSVAELPSPAHGLIVLCVNNRYSITHSKTIIDQRAIFVTVQPSDLSEPFTILAVYGPAQTGERSPFWQKLTQLTAHESVDFLVGDLNCGSDLTPPLITTLIDIHNLTDAASITKNLTPTFTSPSSKEKYRPDRCFVSPRFATAITGLAVVPVSYSDHAYSLVMFSDNNPAFRSPFHRIPLSHVERARKKMNPSRLYKMESHSLPEWLIFKKSLLTHLSRVIRNKDTHDPSAKDRIDAQKLFRLKGKTLWNEIPYNKVRSVRAHNAALQRFTEITDDQGTSSIPAEMSEKAHRFYQDLYDLPNFDAHALTKLLDHVPEFLTLEEQIGLGTPFTTHEIKDAIKSMKPYGAPGTDGIHAGFYKEILKLIVPCLTAIFNSFMDGSDIPTEFKSSMTILIYKNKGSPSNLANRRPISLLNTDYKILSRALTFRMMKVATRLISPYQTGFVTRRSIYENVLAAQMIKTTYDDVALDLIDFEKAYDSISHDAIEYTLLRLGFPPLVVKLILNMVRGSVTRVVVNGVFSEPIHLRRGVKQGDPLSPLLFNFAIEPLARTLMAKLPPINDIPRVLFYADDLLLVRNSPQCSYIAKKVLDRAHSAIGLKVNAEKSLSIPDSRNTLRFHPYPIVKKGESTRYLGFQIGWDGIINDFDTQFNKSVAALQSWRKDFHLSVRTRALILKIFGLAVVWYHMVVLPLTPLQSLRLERLQSWFMWDRTNEPFDPNKSYSNHMTVARVIRPSNMGGLQLYSYPHRAIALKARHFRRLLVHGSPWISSLIGEYLLHVSPPCGPPPPKVSRLDDFLEVCPPVGNPFPVITSPNWSLIAANQDPIYGMQLAHQAISGLQASSVNHGPTRSRKLRALQTLSHALEMLPPDLRFSLYKEYETPGSGCVDFIPLTSEIFSLITKNESVIVTPAQREWETRFNISFEKIWSLHHQWTGVQRDKNVAWDFLQSTLARAKGEICPNCPDLIEDREHIFFNCPRNSNIRLLISKQAKLWNLPRPPDWSLRNFLRSLSSNPGKYFRSTALLISAIGLAWRIRNRQKHDKTNPIELAFISASEWPKTIAEVEYILVRNKGCFTGPAIQPS
jgi:endonuclease/exonuclease/phosphatase family metal-dependent hydrolase